MGALFIKDEGQRLGLGGSKALGGAYAVTRLALDHAVGFEALESLPARRGGQADPLADLGD